MIAMHANHEMGMDMPNCTMDMMRMYFHIGYEPYILLKEWAVKNDGAMIGSCIFFLILSVAYEWLKLFRTQLLVRKCNRNLEVDGRSLNPNATSGDCCGDETNPRANDPIIRRESLFRRLLNNMFSAHHLIQTLLHVIQVIVSYLLMLAFMVFNVWICLSIVFGAGIGFFAFGWKRTRLIELNEDPCH